MVLFRAFLTIERESIPAYQIGWLVYKDNHSPVRSPSCYFYFLMLTLVLQLIVVAAFLKLDAQIASRTC
jgi:hypothetical protein